MHLFKALLLTIATTIPAHAMESADQARLEDAIEAYGENLETGNYKAIVAAIPPAVISLISSQAQLSPETVRTSVTAQLATIMGGASVESFTMDVDAMTSGTTEAGTGYAFLPTTSRISIDGGAPLSSDTQTLAMDIDNTWYLIRIEQPQQYTIVRAAYPEFADIPLPD